MSLFSVEKILNIKVHRNVKISLKPLLIKITESDLIKPFFFVKVFMSSSFCFILILTYNKIKPDTNDLKFK